MAVMALPRSRLIWASLWTLGVYLAPSACAVSDDDPIDEGECLFGPTCGIADSGMAPGTSTLVDAAIGGRADASMQGELCGVGSCLPEDVSSCDGSADAGVDAAVVGVTDAGAADRDADLPAAVQTGADAEAPSIDAGDAAVTGGDDAAGPGSGSETGDADSGLSPSGPLACQIVGTAEQPERRCLPTGTRELSAPCEDSAECAAGLACVAESGQGHCLPYCCSGSDVCAVGSYCAPRPALRDGHARIIPACVAADDCSLDEGFPCAGDSCVCRTGTACTVVRGDGTTSCEAPGRGLDGEECPCAAGYFCSPTSGTCLQICKLTDSTSNDCLAGHCQMAAGFPEGWGLCVGANAAR
jgi:hypothetical protein